MCTSKIFWNLAFGWIMQKDLRQYCRDLIQKNLEILHFEMKCGEKSWTSMDSHGISPLLWEGFALFCVWDLRGSLASPSAGTSCFKRSDKREITENKNYGQMKSRGLFSKRSWSWSFRSRMQRNLVPLGCLNASARGSMLLWRSAQNRDVNATLVTWSPTFDPR